MAPGDTAGTTLPRRVLHFLTIAAVGVVVLVGGLVWDVVGHERSADSAHGEDVLTVANPAHVVFLVGLVAVIVGIAGGSVGAVVAAGRAERRRQLWVGAVAAITLGTGSAGLVAVSTPAGDIEAAVPGGHLAEAPAAPHAPAPAEHDLEAAGAHPQHPAAACAPTAVQKAAADRLLADTRSSVSRFAVLAAATNEGYRPVTPASWSTVHYVNPAYLQDGSVLDPARPEALIYANTGRGPVLAAGMYLMNRPGEPGPEVGGCLTRWHTHTDLCFSPETLEVVGFVTGDGTCSQGSISYVPPDMMHVWVVDVPGGPFAHEVDGAALARSLGD